MPKYLSALKLGISPEERDALIWVLQKLTEQCAVHVLSEHTGDPDAVPADRLGFNMNDSSREYDCGTVCCLGGWASLKMQGAVDKAKRDKHGHLAFRSIEVDKADDYVFQFQPRYKDSQRYDEGLSGLYFPPQDRVRYESVTPDIARDVLEGYLLTGKADWPTVE